MVTVMLSQNKKVISSVRVLLLGAPLFLAACHSDFGPYPMPSGYIHHDKLYKAPPGPEPVLKKIEHGHIEPAAKPGCEPCAMPQAQAEPVMAVAPDEAYSHAAHDLMTRLVNDFGQPAEPVYLRPATDAPHEMHLEKALRAAMAEKGMTVAPAPGLGPFTLNYNVSSLSVGDGSRTMVAVTLTDTNGVVQEVSGIYSLGMPVAAAPAPIVLMEEEPVSEPAVIVAPGEPMPIGPLN